MKETYYKSFLIVIFMSLHFGSKAQSRLSGEIIDKANAPVPGVLVDFADGLVQTTSDSDGKFSLLYPDTVTNRVIQFYVFSYKKKRMQINKGQEKIRVILLDSLFELKNVVISAPKYGRFSDYSAQTIQMSTFDIVTNPAAMADILGNMRVLPGVQTNDNDGRLIIQGGSPEESQVYINDLIVMNPYSLSAANSGVRSRFTPDLFDGIVLQSGGSNAEFGQALSGIVNLNTKEKETMEAKTDVSVSSVFIGLTHIDKKPSYSYRASLTYSNLAPYQQLFPDKYEWNKPFQQIQADFFLTKDFSAKTRVTAQLNLSNTGLDFVRFNVDSVRFNNDLKQNYLYAQVNVYHEFNRQWNLSLASNVVVDDFSGTEVQSINDRIKSTNIWNHNKINLQYAKENIVNRTGLEYIHNPYKETYTLGLEYKNKISNDLLSFYNDTKLYLTNNLTASIGLRSEYSNYLNQFNFAPRIYVGYQLNPGNIVSASVGEYFQLPAMEYLKLSDAITFASATKGTVSYSYVKKSSKLQVDAYYKKYKNAITYQQGQYQPVDIANDGSGYGLGTDVFLKNNFKSLEYWLTYSYNDTKKRQAYFAEKVIPDYVARHSFNATLKYWIAPLKSMLGGSYNIASGAPYYNELLPHNKLGTTPLRNRLDIAWSYLPRSNIILHFGCQNLLGYKNVYGYHYSQINPGVRSEITNPSTRFFFVGLFITFSHDKNLNQLKSL